jgi:hypothetical protein
MPEVAQNDKSIFLVVAHVVNDTQIDLLHNICKKIKENGYDYILASHTNVPDHIILGSRAFTFDTNNHTIPVEGRDLSQRGIFWMENPEFRLYSPFFFHGGMPCYAVSHIHNLYNGLLLAKRFQYQYVHLMVYDTDFDLDDIKGREKLMSSGEFDFIGYFLSGRLLGDQYSINIGKIDTEELFLSQDEMDKRISDLLHDDSYYLMKYLVRENGMKCDKREIPRSRYKELTGAYSGPTHGKRFNWALYQIGPNEEIMFFFSAGQGEEITRVELIGVSSGVIRRDVSPNCYFTVDIFDPEYLGMFSIFVDGVFQRSIDLSNPQEKAYWVDTTEFVSAEEMVREQVERVIRS